MSFENESICFWKMRTLANYINSCKFKCNNPNKDNILLENNDYSITTDNTCEILATPTTNYSNSEDTHEFLFYYKAFQNGKEKVSLDECNEELVKDIELGCKLLPPNVIILESANEYDNKDSHKYAFINHITEFIVKLIEVKIENRSNNNEMLLVETAYDKNGLRIIHEIKNKISKEKVIQQFKQLFYIQSIGFKN
ncbi:7736_t:CDS:2, partial [Funneliformis mosseae]